MRWQYLTKPYHDYAFQTAMKNGIYMNLQRRHNGGPACYDRNNWEDWLNSARSLRALDLHSDGGPYYFDGFYWRFDSDPDSDPFDKTEHNFARMSNAIKGCKIVDFLFTDYLDDMVPKKPAVDKNLEKIYAQVEAETTRIMETTNEPFDFYNIEVDVE